MKKAVILSAVLLITLVASTTFAGRCEFYQWKSNVCKSLSDRISAQLCDYHQWPEAPCEMVAPVKFEKLVLEGVLFDSGSAEIKAKSYAVLDSNVGKLKEREKLNIVVVGYTDDRGNDANNQALSEKRANRVKNYFVNKGINPSRISAVGRGEASPRADNSTPDGRAMNRRIEIETN
ncbi:OmpA family protein [bacterium]|nr:OmpA family protein [bacterium]